MKHPVLALVLLAAPLSAQEKDPPSMMERGAELFLEGLLNEMEPALEGMQDFLRQMGPAMREILSEIEDWSVYAPPEVLPNGDIIIRRKEPLTPEKVPPSDETPSIEL